MIGNISNEHWEIFKAETWSKRFPSYDFCQQIFFLIQ